MSLSYAVDREALAQEASIHGRVVEAGTEEAIEGATVALWAAHDSSLVTGTVTNSAGQFDIDGIRSGRYYVEASFVGFMTYRSETLSVDPAGDVDLGELSLRPDTQILDEVEVEAERQFMEVGVDRMVYNTSEQLVTVGGNASNVLETIPSVETDIDGNISLRGNQNVAIHINGRASPMTGDALTTFLEGLPADAVERVEVIPNPSARHDPEGMAGIINIVLREDQDPGLTGGFSLSAGTQQNYNASANVGYQVDRIGLFAAYGFRYGTRSREGSRFRENRFSGPISFIDQDNLSDGSRQSHTLNTGAEYQLSDRDRIAAAAIVSHRTGRQDGLSNYLLLDRAELPVERYDRREEGDATDLNLDLRLSFDRIFDRGDHEFSAEVRFENERERDLDEYAQDVHLSSSLTSDLTDELETNLDDEHEQEVSFRLDYMRPLPWEGGFEAGYEAEWERSDQEQYAEFFDEDEGRWLPDVARNNAFVYDEMMHSAYGIVSGSFERFRLQAGIRAERAATSFDLRSEPEPFDNSYFSLFPSAFLTYEMSEARSIRLSYSKRVWRPGSWQLNPFDRGRDRLFRSIGNPALTPQYVHSMEASATQFTERTSLTLTPYFRRTVDVIRRIETIDEEGVSVSTFENFDTRDSWGAEMIARLELGDWMSGFTSMNVYRVVTDGSNLDTDLSNDAYGFSMRTNASFAVAPGLDLQVSHYYRAPIETERGRVSSRSSADIAVRQRLMNNRASLSLRARDVFDQRNFHVIRDDALYFQESRSNWDARQVSLTFRYNFGQPDRDRDRRGGQRDEPPDDEFEME